MQIKSFSALSLFLAAIFWPVAAQASCVMAAGGFQNLTSTTCWLLGLGYFTRAVISLVKSAKSAVEKTESRRLKRRALFSALASLGFFSYPFVLKAINPNSLILVASLIILVLVIDWGVSRLSRGKDVAENKKRPLWKSLAYDPVFMLSAIALCLMSYIQIGLYVGEYKREQEAKRITCCSQQEGTTFREMSDSISDETGHYSCGKLICYTCDQNGKRLHLPANEKKSESPFNSGEAPSP